MRVGYKRRYEALGKASQAFYFKAALADVDREVFKNQLPDTQLKKWAADFPLLDVRWMAPADLAKMVKVLKAWSHDNNTMQVTPVRNGEGLSIKFVGS